VPSRDRTHEQVIQFDNAVYRSGVIPTTRSQTQSRTLDPGNMQHCAYAAPSTHIERRGRADPAIRAGEWISLSYPTLPVPERIDFPSRRNVTVTIRRSIAPSSRADEPRGMASAVPQDLR
jgi:hypothetical protein